MPRVVALLILADAEEDGAHTMDHCRTMAIVRRDLITEQKAFLKVTNFCGSKCLHVCCVCRQIWNIYILQVAMPLGRYDDSTCLSPFLEICYCMTTSVFSTYILREIVIMLIHIHIACASVGRVLARLFVIIIIILPSSSSSSSSFNDIVCCSHAHLDKHHTLTSTITHTHAHVGMHLDFVRLVGRYPDIIIFTSRPLYYLIFRNLCE